MNALQFSLFVSALIFSCGIGMALSRRNAIMVLIGIELMMNAANINFIAFWRFVHANNDINGMIFVIPTNTLIRTAYSIPTIRRTIKHITPIIVESISFP